MGPRGARSSPAPPPVLPQAAASRVASLRLACPPLLPCPEARLCAPHRCSPSAWMLTEIEWERIPVRPSAPPRHPAPASISVGRRHARWFPPGQSPSPLMGAVPRPALGSRVSPWIFSQYGESWLSGITNMVKIPRYMFRMSGRTAVECSMSQHGQKRFGMQC